MISSINYNFIKKILKITRAKNSKLQSKFCQFYTKLSHVPQPLTVLLKKKLGIDYIIFGNTWNVT